MVHEFEQVLPALFPEACLHMTQKRQVLLSGVGLREQVLEGLSQWQQDLPMIHWLIPDKLKCSCDVMVTVVFNIVCPKTFVRYEHLRTSTGPYRVLKSIIGRISEQMFIKKTCIFLKE